MTLSQILPTYIKRLNMKAISKIMPKDRASEMGDRIADEIFSMPNKEHDLILSAIIERMKKNYQNQLSTLRNLNKS
jgi:hypothetical protein